MIKLYGIPVSNNVNKVRYCLNYLGLEYEFTPTNPIEGENHAEDYLAICPTAKIPAMSDDGFNLFESHAINRYLATRENSSIYPADVKQRAEVDAWSDYVNIHVAGAVSRVVFNRLLAPIVGAEVDEKSIEAGLSFLDKQLPVLDKQLSANIYLAGKELTLADIALLATLDPCEGAGIDLSPYQNIIKWREGLKVQAFYQKCYKDFTIFVQEAMQQMMASK